MGVGDLHTRCTSKCCIDEARNKQSIEVCYIDTSGTDKFLGHHEKQLDIIEWTSRKNFGHHGMEIEVHFVCCTMLWVYAFVTLHFTAYLL